ncbi:regulatory protein RecX [Tamlana sp. 2_MG-2023]|uniref:regulatory protein RecX n=1 Tax=unclassified Tamlana TaxID=2614803 RepID=UPI0026E3C7DE|nr:MULTISPECIES: regulatory protein RecX [unclassified Tamlana]MDO6759879.1 regulatory protein RecX [Tamlana sp. 2_MG-2023]MDO6791951.1 regulatory protein RecX [Tamlana sp. 1_MG-2023]
MQSKKTYTVQEATKKLEHYCAYQERCHQEVRKKLVSMYMIPEAIDVIIVHLLDHNFLNEERFAKAFVRGKFRIKHWGRRRLTSELKQKDISKYNITQALAEINDDEYLTVLSDLSEKRANLIKEVNTYKKRKKFIDYFLYRGWESHLVYEKAHEFIT